MQILVLLVIGGLVELGVIIKVGEAIGVLNTLALLVLVSLIGAWLVKHQGLSVLRRVQRDLAEGRTPGPALADGFLVLIAGVMLLTPGFVTDAVGLLLLLPPVRLGVRTWLRRRWSRRLEWRSRPQLQ